MDKSLVENPNDPSGLDVKGAFRKDYSLAQYHFVKFISEHLTDCSRVFHGDLQQVMVLAIVGQSYLDAITQGDNAMLPSHVPRKDTSITASSIADVTGIARETVRRKLDALAARGWIVRGPSHGWTLAVSGERSKAKDDLAELDRRGIERAAKLLSALTKIA